MADYVLSYASWHKFNRMPFTNRRWKFTKLTPPSIELWRWALINKPPVTKFS